MQQIFLLQKLRLKESVKSQLFGTFVFFSFGFALLGEIGATIAALIGIGLFIIQIQFSKFWFTYFQYGIFEWLWRSLTYLKIQPLRR